MFDLSIFYPVVHVKETDLNRPGGVKRQDTQAKRDDLIEASHQSYIHRILDGYYNFLHKFWWLVLVASTAVIITCAVFAAGLTLPTSSDVTLLPDSNQYQMHYSWGENLLSKVLAKEAGSEALITWGVSCLLLFVTLFNRLNITSRGSTFPSLLFSFTLTNNILRLQTPTII